jgi:phosphoglycerate dehydrogenase-like enzyme
VTADRPVALVLGASADAPPPGIEAADDVLDLRYAPDADSLRAALPGAQALYFWHGEREELETVWPAAGDLRWIQTASAGVDGLLFPGLVDSDVVVTNARGVFDEPIAEWVIGAMLAFATGLHRSIVDQQAGVWGHDRSTERLEGKHLTVVGPGPIGRATASRALALGMTVTLVGRSARHDEMFGTVVGPEGFGEALGAADYVLDALPFTPDNAELFDAAAFAAMRPSARFINVGRGTTVDEPALIEALRTGTIAGAALDVFVEEPLPAQSPLWAMPQVIVSPHVSGDVTGWERAVVQVFTDNAARWVRGERLVNLIDKRAGHGTS